jgi:BCD family chlorophyll transporter-like MFS transporter
MKTLIRILNNIRLAAYPISYGLAGALIGGTLNRVMIADLSIPASLVGIFFALPLLVSPARVWLGYRSDGFPIFGKRREPYIISGGIVTALGMIAATITSLQFSNNLFILSIGAILAFTLYGIGRNLGHNTFQALLSDRFEGDGRSRAITLYEVATLLGLVGGAGGLGSALEVFDPSRLTAVTIGAAGAVVFLALFASIGQEPAGKTSQIATKKAREMPFSQVLEEVVLADKQVRMFFVLVFLTFVGTLAQDVLLEPYGALVLGMQVGDTTRLTAFWGVGVMISMLLSGIFLIKLFGQMTVMRAGIIASVLVFIGIILAGAVGAPDLFRSLVFVMGLGTGLAGAGMLANVINFTTPIRAGMLMGVWGVANMVGHAFGSLMGGIIVDLMRLATGGNALIAYSTVFSIEVIFLLVALYLSTRLDVSASRAQTEEFEKLSSAMTASAD